MTPELKPCPFCGGTARFEKILVKSNVGCDVYAWHVVCYDCGVKTFAKGDEAIRDDKGIRLIEDGRQEAIAAWNRRYTEEKQ